MISLFGFPQILSLNTLKSAFDLLTSDEEVFFDSHILSEKNSSDDINKISFTLEKIKKLILELKFIQVLVGVVFVISISHFSMPWMVSTSLFIGINYVFITYLESKHFNVQKMVIEPKNLNLKKIARYGLIGILALGNIVQFFFPRGPKNYLNL